MQIRYKFLFSILLLSLCFVSCRKNPYKVNISSMKADIEIKRLEKDLFTINPEEIGLKLPDLKD